jgi:predicted O-methyltransferase YrrM
MTQTGMSRFPFVNRALIRLLKGEPGKVDPDQLRYALKQVNDFLAAARRGEDRYVAEAGLDSVEVSLRGLLTRVRALDGLPAEPRADLDRLITSLPTHFARGGMRFSNDLVSAFAPAWKQDLAHLVGKPARFLEVGSAEGQSATWLCEHVLTHDDAGITCVDTFDMSGQPVAPTAERARTLESQFDANVAASGRAHKIDKRIGRSQEVLRGLPLAHYDFIYIDGSHVPRDVLEDAVLAYRLVKPGGLMTFDDYLADADARTAPKTGVDAFLSFFGDSLELVRKGIQLTMRRIG